MSASTAVYLQAMHTCQLALSSYGILQSYIAITNLQTYEGAATKLAKWSDEASKQLQLTRTTQTSGAIALLLSVISSAVLAIFTQQLPSWVRFTLPPMMLIVTLFARGHIMNYWAPSDGKTVGVKIDMPGIKEYSEAQRRTEAILKTLEYLEYGWVATSFVGGMLGWK